MAGLVRVNTDPKPRESDDYFPEGGPDYGSPPSAATTPRRKIVRRMTSGRFGLVTEVEGEKIARSMFKGIVQHDVTFKFKTYRGVFSGVEACTWLRANGHAQDEGAAVALGRELLDSSFIDYVRGGERHFACRDHHLYRFAARVTLGNEQLLQALALQVDELEKVAESHRGRVEEQLHTLETEPGEAVRGAD
jgi:hypothetical protein